MKRMKKHKTKPVMPETSSIRLKDSEEHDLAYYIHDKVELMHQVFSVIKTKELKAMIPQCVKNISLDDLQELCTDELLGISSKRLCAILDGAEPPSDTESSNSSIEQFETISLDSISSDDEILSQNSSKNKKHKHKKRKAKNMKNKHRRRESEKNDESSGEEKNRASRAGLTVLELLELQARARAIRAQLQKDQINNRAPECTENTETGKSDDEVEIKEEPAEVVEISSEDEKPNVELLKAQQTQKSIDQDQTTQNQENPNTVTKRINDLIITVPQTKQSRKIKLNRNKVVVCETTKTITSANSVDANKDETKINTKEIVKSKDAKNAKSKKKDKKRERVNKKDGSDHDEITLQLSDSEKMDLLEDLDRKNYDSVSSSSKDSEDSSESSDDSSNRSLDVQKAEHKESEKENEKIVTAVDADENIVVTNEIEMVNKIENHKNDSIDVSNSVPFDHKEDIVSDVVHIANEQIILSNNGADKEVPVLETEDKTTEETTDLIERHESKCEIEISEQKLSDGEISEESDTAVVTEITCVLDKEKTKKKKDKKSKKKSKKSYNDKENESDTKVDNSIEILTINDDDEEIFELSDSSSCYEVDGVSVLSKEPTTNEIEALSAKVDLTIREEIGEEVEDNENIQSEKEDAENISWKDRYLESKKVKGVLKTSKILNALRKKNRELKKKLEESKKVTIVTQAQAEVNDKVEGTIDEYNNLEGSTKYVDPVSEKTQELDGEVKEVTKEMEKDAKQLLKMYKKLLKYNDMNRQKSKDPNRKKAKKSKKKKEKHKGANEVNEAS